MRFLVDEGMPVQVLASLRLNRPHEFEHVNDLLWVGKPDRNLFADAAAQGFDGIITLNVGQLTNRQEWRALRQSGLHHISIRQGRTVQGAKGVARVLASIIAAMPYILEELESQRGQRIIEVMLLAGRPRHVSRSAAQVSRDLR